MVSTSNCNVPANAVWFMTLQVWNNDVRFYCVKNLSDVPIAYFYFDPYSRPHGKRGGAWVDLVVGRSRVVSHDATSCRLPVVHIVCNQTPPLAGKPSLMTFREVGSAFHIIFLHLLISDISLLMAPGWGSVPWVRPCPSAYADQSRWRSCFWYKRDRMGCCWITFSVHGTLVLPKVMLYKITIVIILLAVSFSFQPFVRSMPHQIPSLPWLPIVHTRCNLYFSKWETLSVLLLQ